MPAREVESYHLYVTRLVQLRRSKSLLQSLFGEVIRYRCFTYQFIGDASVRPLTYQSVVNGLRRSSNRRQN